MVAPFWHVLLAKVLKDCIGLIGGSQLACNRVYSHIYYAWRWRRNLVTAVRQSNTHKLDPDRQRGSTPARHAGFAYGRSVQLERSALSPQSLAVQLTVAQISAAPQIAIS